MSQGGGTAVCGAARPIGTKTVQFPNPKNPYATLNEYRNQKAGNDSASGRAGVWNQRLKFPPRVS
jgi:hypothetical protein